MWSFHKTVELLEVYHWPPPPSPLGHNKYKPGVPTCASLIVFVFVFVFQKLLDFDDPSSALFAHKAVTRTRVCGVTTDGGRGSVIIGVTTVGRHTLAQWRFEMVPATGVTTQRSMKCATGATTKTHWNGGGSNTASWRGKA